jgi:RNA polymerase sigma factor (sigma-70 family)
MQCECVPELTGSGITAGARPVRSPEERDRLVCANLGLAHYAAGRFLARWPALARAIGDFEDLVSVAHVGLVKAARHYDPARGVKFSTYAHAAMLGELRREALSADLVRVPERLRGAERAAARRRCACVSLSALKGQEGADYEPSCEPDPAAGLQAAELRARVARELDKLPPRLAVVCRERFLRDPPLSLQEVGALLGVTRERARVLEARAKELLRLLLADLDEAAGPGAAAG